MVELRINGKTPDGTHLSLLDPDGTEHTVRISDTLRATVNQPRLTSVPENEDETISIKEIQRRLRAGISPDEIVRENNISIEKIERFSGPIIQERRYIIDQVQQIIIRKESGRDPVNFLGVVVSRLAPHSVDMAELSWQTWRQEDGTWILELHYPNNSKTGMAQFIFDPSRRVIASNDENARWILGEELPARNQVESGLVYNESPHTARLSDSVQPIRETPRLAVIREEPDAEAARDGIIGRAKVPSWDEIMFGMKPKEDQ